MFNSSSLNRIKFGETQWNESHAIVRSQYSVFFILSRIHLQYCFNVNNV